MCTVSWMFRDAGLRVVFNRDELRSRAAGLPPCVQVAQGVAFLAPVDPVGGGTWIAANGRGLVVALLNHTPGDGGVSARVGGQHLSRGLLVPELIVHHGVSGVCEALPCLSLQRFRPFELVAVDASGDVGHAVWDGVRLGWRVADRVGAASTSSFATAEVLVARRAAWGEVAARAAAGDVAAQDAFHAREDPLHPARGVRMVRPDARTVSRAVVEVGAARVVLAVADLDESGAESGRAVVEIPRGGGA
jgi:hypothetical protein